MERKTLIPYNVKAICRFKNFKSMIKFIKKWNIANIMARLFPFVAVSCLIWYELDPNIESMYAKIQLSITGLFASSKIIVMVHEL